MAIHQLTTTSPPLPRTSGRARPRRGLVSPAALPALLAAATGLAAGVTSAVASSGLAPALGYLGLGLLATRLAWLLRPRPRGWRGGASPAYLVLPGLLGAVALALCGLGTHPVWLVVATLLVAAVLVRLSQVSRTSGTAGRREPWRPAPIPAGRRRR